VAAAGSVWERRVDFVIVVLLAVASLVAAWAGHQAVLWSDKQAAFITDAETQQIEATRLTTIGYEMMHIDVTLFLAWLNADRQDNASLAAFYQDRFTPSLSTAFTAWLATDPLINPDAPLDPFRMPEYQVPQLQEAMRFDEQAARSFVDASNASATSEAFVLATMLLAVVLFFGGVSAKITTRPAQLALLTITTLLLLYTIWKLGALPDGSTLGLTPRWG
jgi:hypothetical protein